MTREEAIKWIDDRMCFGRGTFTEHHPPNIDECWQAGMMAIEALSDEAVKGEWIKKQVFNPELDKYVQLIECSVCGYEPYYGGSEPKFNYCANCGADMRGEQDE